MAATESARSARSCTPGMRWWCNPAVDLGSRICCDCFNTSVPGLSRCGSCTVEHGQRIERKHLRVEYLHMRVTVAREQDDIVTALIVDDTLECVHDMHADLRLTCYSCKSWVDHAHDWLTGERIELAEYDAIRACRGSSPTTVTVDTTGGSGSASTPAPADSPSTPPDPADGPVELASLAGAVRAVNPRAPFRPYRIETSS